MVNNSILNTDKNLLQSLVAQISQHQPKHRRKSTPELPNSCFQTSLSTRGSFFTCCENTRAKLDISAKRVAHRPHAVLPVKLRCPVRKPTCVSIQTCLNKSGRRHSKPSMQSGTAIQTAAAPPVWAVSTISLECFISGVGNSVISVV